jgi:hypothetical protein
MQIEIAPETERLVRDEIRRGHFRLVDQLIRESVEAWRQKHLLTTVAVDCVADAEPFWKPFTRRMHALPEEVFDHLPEDGSFQHDHYIHGTPKRDA